MSNKQRKKLHKKTKNKKAAHQNKKKQPVQAELKKPNRVIRFFKSTYGIIAVIVTVAGLITLFDIPQKVRELTMSDKEKWEEERFLKGIFLPPDIMRDNDSVILDCGTVKYLFQLSKLKEGVEVKPTSFMINRESIFGLRLLLKKNRLYIHTVIKDIDGEVVGIIDYEKWRLLKNKIVNVSDTEESLEIIDKLNNVNFSLLYQYPNKILLQGYFTNAEKIVVVSDGVYVFNNDQKENAIRVIEKIKKIGEK